MELKPVTLYQYYGEKNHNFNIAQRRRCTTISYCTPGDCIENSYRFRFCRYFLFWLRFMDFVTDPRGGNKLHPWGTARS
ncbi:hypothetical protein, partial [Clostridium butanoliproducens]|uniref:hypothetical protein n=1 Tax=Clostridium butanoliproducens TaxID=2991837 RepID=UPI0024BB683C